MLQNLKAIIVLFVLVNTIVSAQSYTLVWSDEFLGTSLKEENWTRETGGGGWGNNELQYYTGGESNSYIEDGKLVIEAKQESFGGRDYTSARLKTEGKKFFKYGRIEARMKLPYGQGIWPAFWMLGESIGTIGWPACGEIDIMEMIGGTFNENVVHGTLHWEENGHASYGGRYVLSNGIFADDYHVFSVEWTPQFMKWYVDGIQYHVTDITPSGLSEFHENFFIILNMAVGGDWPGSPNASTVFPQKMYIDYVRVYVDQSAIPEVTISEPVASTFPANSDIYITADVDFVGEIERVDFYQDAVKIGSTDIKPYAMMLRDVYPGCYKISASAVTSQGYTGKSLVKEITVGESCVEAPYKGSITKLPGKIEVENFNIGEAGEAFNDNDVQNQGGVYRLSDQVDLEECSDDGTYNIGFTAAGEWTDYLVDLETGGAHTIIARVASENANGKFHIELDGNNITGTMSSPNTGGWQVWQSVEITGVVLEPGIYTLRLVIEQGDFNINYLEVYPDNAEPKIQLLYPNGGESFGRNDVAEVRWRSWKVKNVSIGLSTDNGSSWNFITQTTTTEFGFFRWQVPDILSDECLVMVIDKSNSSTRDVSDNLFSIDEVSGISDDIVMPGDPELGNYPNPFNPVTTIRFTIPLEFSNEHVTLVVYDLLGNKVRELVNESLPAGIYSREFTGTDLVSGVYFTRLSVAGTQKTLKLNLLK